MRLLRLDLAHGSSTIDLHPFVTVARELSTAELDELLESIRRLAQGSTAGIRGLVQNQGLLVDLDGFGDDGALAITGANVVVDCDATAAAGIAGLRMQVEQTTRRAEIDAVVVEEIRADLDPAARARVSMMEAELGPDDDAHLAALDAAIDRVAGALDAASAQPPVVDEATDEILELRRRWSAYANRRSAAEQHFAALMENVKYAEGRALSARESMANAAEAAKPVLLSRSEEARLEALSFPDQDETRRGKWRKVLRPEEEEEKAEMLARVGVESWTAYTVYRVAPTAPPGKREAAEAAKRSLAEAEALLDEARTSLATDELTSDLNDEEDAIRAEARPHLGQLLPADLGEALQELVVQRPNPAWLRAVGELNDVLPSIDPPRVESATSPIEAELRPEEADGVVVAAERWLVAKRRERADIDFDRIRDELGGAKRQLARHDRALQRIERAEAAAASSRNRLEALQALLAGGVEHDGDAVPAVLALLAPIVAQVEQEAGGSVPIAVIGTFGTLTDDEACQLMDELERYASTLQVVVVSDHAAIGAWAQVAGLDRALVSRPKVIDQAGVA